MNNEKTISPRFHPIQCTSEYLKQAEIHDGEIYFLTDTKQIFIVRNNSLMEMSGGTNIIYGNRTIVYENNGQDIPPEQVFSIEEDLDNISPLENDLILNKDGCFYKVVSVLGDVVQTLRLTLQGSGPSSDGNNTSGGGGSYSLTIDTKNYVFSSKALEIPIRFTAYYNGSDDNWIKNISFSLGKPADEDGSIIFYEINCQEYEYQFNQPHDIDLIEYIDTFGANAKTVYINTWDKYDRFRNTSFSVRLVDLTLDMEYETILQSIPSETCWYSCLIGGATTGITNKKLTFKFSNDESTTSYSIDLNANFLGSYNCSINTDELLHGVYDLEIVLSADIIGTTKTIYSNILKHKLINFVDSANPLFTCVLPNKFERYSNNKFKYYLVSKENKNYTLKIELDGDSLPDLSLSSNMSKTDFLYVDKPEGIYNLNFTIPELGISEGHLIEIVTISTTLPYIDPTDSTLELYLTAQGQSNNLLHPEQWQDYNKKHTAQLSNLNFSKSSGWLVDENQNTYLQLSSGGKLNLTSYQPFKTDPTVPTNGALKGSGMTIELDFEVNGITNYDADIISCISTKKESTDKEISVGFKLVGDSVKLYSNQKNGYGTQGALTNIKIVEGQRTKISFVIEGNVAEGSAEYDSYFPMCYTYINGILSNAVMYDKTDSFNQDSALPAYLTVDSTNASVKIYGIRVYRKSLTSKEIINNYTASLPSQEEKEKVFKATNVYNSQMLIDYEKISSEEYDLQIPYMVLTGGYQTTGSEKGGNKWELKSSQDMGDPGLPTGKKDYRLVDIQVIYPQYQPAKKDESGAVISPAKNEYFKDYKNYNFTNQFKDGGWITDNFGKKPNNGGCIMYAQGTSSMEYPVKNLRLRFNKVKKVVDGEEITSKENFFTVRPDIKPVEIICMKADYMESSGSHNTGAANLVDDLYRTAGMKTPGQDHFGPQSTEDTDKSTIVTCIKGHPCLIFYSPTGEKGSYEYIGKYNLNLDKATPEPFGFDHDDSDFGYLSTGDKYYAVQYDDDGKKFIGQESPTDGGDYDDTKEGEELKTVQEGEKINSIHCFEFLDNAVAVCNFLSKSISENDKKINPVDPETFFYEKAKNINSESFEKLKEAGIYLYILENGNYKKVENFNSSEVYYERKYTYEDTWYRTFKNSKGDLVPGWSLGFESRYPEDRIGYHDADALYPLASWLNELYYLKTLGKSGNGATEIEIAEANARFKNEYTLYFNKDFLLFYYILTEALLMADSRVKNMMIAAWEKKEKSYKPLKYDESKSLWLVNEAATPIKTKYYEWYPIFYDMDTMLGLDNTGRDRFTYYAEDTDASIYNGDEVLWNFVRDNLAFDLDNMYKTLEEGALNVNKNERGEWLAQSLIPYFNKNQANMANEAFYNGDAVYKYIDPAREGYYDGLNGKDIKAGEGPYLYAAQGSRTLARENFIVNRIKFLQGKHTSGRFRDSDQVEFRWNFPYADTTKKPVVVTFTGSKIYEQGKYYYIDEYGNYQLDSSESPVDKRVYYEFVADSRIGASAAAVQPTTNFEFTALQPGFAGVMLGKNGNVYKRKFNKLEKASIPVPEGSSANNTEAYLLGLSSLKDLGDLSNKYVQKFVMSGNNKLSTLTLGNAHKDYYNPFWSSDTDASKIDLRGCTYLETFNLYNCESFQTALDFSKCPLIKNIYLTGSSVSNITLPINGNITELRLPSTITKLNIESHCKLTKTNFSLGTYNYGTGNSIGQKDCGGSFVNDFSRLTDVCIINTPIDSYQILSNAVSLDKYYVKDFEWTIDNANDCQYIYTKDESPIKGKDYYNWNSNEKQFKRYEGNGKDELWITAREKCSLVTEVEVGEPGATVKEKVITQIPILEQLLTKIAYYNGKNLSLDENNPGANGLVGKIIINLNNSNIKVNEFDIYTKYQRYFPNVTLEFQNVAVTPAFRVNFYNKEHSPGLTPYYSVLTDGTKTLKELTSEDTSPNGVALKTPQKPSTLSHIYEFIHWQLVGTEDALDLSTYIPKGNTEIEAFFDDNDRNYKVKFFDYEGKLHSEIQDYLYEQAISNHKDCVFYLHRPHEDEQKTDSHYRWDFKGWISESDFNNKITNPTLINLDTTKVLSDINLYAYYGNSPVDCRTTASNLDFFEFENRNINGTSIRYVNVKDKYKNILSGALTIPAKDNNNNYITGIGLVCPKNNKLTKVYIQDGSKTIWIGGFANNEGISAGFYDTDIKYIYFPSNMETLTHIGNNSFYYSTKLSMIENLPDSIKSIGDSAFYGDDNLSLTKLPTNIETLEQNAFHGCGKVNITVFGCPDINGPLDGFQNRLVNIGANAFFQAGEGVQDLVLNKSLQLTENCFQQYGKRNYTLTVENYTGIEDLTPYFGREVSSAETREKQEELI